MQISSLLLALRPTHLRRHGTPPSEPSRGMPAASQAFSGSGYAGLPPSFYLSPRGRNELWVQVPKSNRGLPCSRYWVLYDRPSFLPLGGSKMEGPQQPTQTEAGVRRLGFAPVFFGHARVHAGAHRSFPSSRPVRRRCLASAVFSSCPTPRPPRASRSRCSKSTESPPSIRPSRSLSWKAWISATA